MTLADLGNLGEFVGAIGVVISLLYLAAQIRQNTKSVRSSTHHASVVAGNAVQLAFAEADAAEITLKAGRAYDELTLEQRFRFTMLMRAFLSFEEDVFIQYREGLIDRAFWDARARVLAEALAQPGVRKWWARNCHAYTTSFQEAIGELLAA
jgi:hypothetical protein